MLRLALVFTVWIASTAHAIDEPEDFPGGDDADWPLRHAYERVWVNADDERRALLENAQLAWAQYRLANCAAYGRADADCLASMAEERAAELRNLAADEDDPGCDSAH